MKLILNPRKTTEAWVEKMPEMCNKDLEELKSTQTVTRNGQN